MSKSNATETDLLEFIFNGTAVPWAAATDLDIHLHTADPGEAGIATTNECAYTSYAPITVARSGAAWLVAGNNADNIGILQFPQCTGGTETATHVSISPDGSTIILYSGALNASLNISNGIQPQFAAGALDIQED
jgi:hypothetical protein